MPSRIEAATTVGVAEEVARSPTSGDRSCLLLVAPVDYADPMSYASAEM